MIKVRDLTKKYGENTVVSSLNFDIEKGKIYGFLGPNGAGKSTTMNMITGCLSPSEGEVFINGISMLQNAKEAKKLIGYLPENPPLYPDMTPYEYLSFVASAKGVKGKDAFDEIYACMEATNILSVKDRLIKNLSKGYKQRVGIAQAMLGNPEVIILDEPTVGLDPRQITEIRRLIKNLSRHSTVILSSHILAEISAVCDHVMIISRGNLIASDTLENIRLQNTPKNRIEASVRCSEDNLKKALSVFEKRAEAEYSLNANGVFDIIFEADENDNIIEEISSVFARLCIKLLRLTKTEPSLEEIFLSLTEADYDDEEYDYEPSYSLVSEDENEDDDDYDDEDEDEDDYDDEDDDEDIDDDESGEYKPLFRGKF